MNCKGKIIHFDTPKIMGILNITEHSFYEGGTYFNNPDKYLFHVETMLKEGADIIDVGCMATNPQAKELSEQEELNNMGTVLNHIISHFSDVIFSIDTYRSSVAQMAIEMGAAMINDISGGEFDEKMFAVIARLQVPYILTHTSDKPEMMQQKTDYKDVVNDVFLYLSKKLETLHLLGVNDVIIDPGFGFGKTISQNYNLLNNLQIFKELGCPILVGLSRKSMLYSLLEISPKQALNATTVANTIALLHGATILRVHDVKEACEAVKIVSYISKKNYG